MDHQVYSCSMYIFGQTLPEVCDIFQCNKINDTCTKKAFDGIYCLLANYIGWVTLCSALTTLNVA